MFEEEKVNEEIVLVIDNEDIKPDTKGKILLIDADTIAFAMCSVCEYPLTDDLEGDYDINLEQALELAVGRVNELLDVTGCETAELHFTSGKNFRYAVKADYKMKRTETRYPVGLKALKAMLVPLYANSRINTEVEADDIVCMLKRENPDKYVVCAVDKDVLYGVPGIHFNYQKRAESVNKYGTKLAQINMTWIETSNNVATVWPYLQCLMGDTADSIAGIKGCGPAKTMELLFPELTAEIKQLKAEYKEAHGRAIAGDKIIKLLVIGFNLLEKVKIDEAKLWKIVVQAYRGAAMTETDAIQTMRLVHMHQMTEDGEVVLWTQ